MAFQAVPDTVEIAINYTWEAVPVQNTLHALFAGNYTLADLQALADAVEAEVVSGWLPLQINSLLLTGIEVRGLDQENDLLVENVVANTPGTINIEGVPNSVSLSIKKGSGLTGRSARGRLYWLGMNINANEPADPNFWTSAQVNSVVAAVEAMRTEINAVSGWTAVIVSRFNNNAQREVGVTFEWLTTSAVTNRVASRRDRLPG